MDPESLLGAFISVLTLLAGVRPWIEHRLGRRRPQRRRAPGSTPESALDALRAQLWPLILKERLLATDDLVRLLQVLEEAKATVHRHPRLDREIMSRLYEVESAVETLHQLPFPPTGPGQINDQQLGLRAVRQAEAAQNLLEAIGSLRRVLDRFHVG